MTTHNGKKIRKASGKTSKIVALLLFSPLEDVRGDEKRWGVGVVLGKAKKLAKTHRLDPNDPLAPLVHKIAPQSADASSLMALLHLVRIATPTAQSAGGSRQ